MDAEKGFICEHTAEYVLVPNLIKILQLRFHEVIPIFPWASREGSNLSRQIHKYDRFKVIGLYPRRPKIASVTSKVIAIKINQEILHGAQCGLQMGIPIIAGCPLVKNFWELGQTPNCIWIRLEHLKDERVIGIEDNQAVVKYETSSYFFRDDEELIVYLFNKSRFLDIDSAILSFKRVNDSFQETRYVRYFMHSGFYKPVYFLLK